MAGKNKGVTGHEDLDAHIDRVLEKHGGSIKPSDAGWNRINNLIDQGRKRDADATEKKKQSSSPKASEKPVQKPWSRPKPPKGK